MANSVIFCEQESCISMCIYCIENTLNGKKYIGQTTQKVKRRWKAHIKGDTNNAISLAIKKYGVSSFTLRC